MDETDEGHLMSKMLNMHETYLGDPPAEYDQVKIAVLDTGFKTHQSDTLLAQIHDESEVISHNFIKPGTPACDRAVGGHGAHVCRLIRRIAPNAKVLAAKISEDQCLDYHPEKVICEALKWAGNEGADIIVLPLGIQKNKKLETALDGIKERKLVFASTGNSGSSGSQEWPACEPGVFAIYSVDGSGRPDWGLNPPLSETDDNFAAYGKGVQSFWNGSDVIVEGSSYAAATAAAIAANILEFARQKAPGRVSDSLRQYVGMRHLFRDHLAPESSDGKLHLLCPFMKGFWDGETSSSDITVKLESLDTSRLEF